VNFLVTDSLPAERWAAVHDMHFKRQQRLKTEGHDRYSVFENPVEAQALHLALEWAAQQGYARHYWMDIDDQTAAFSLGLRVGKTYVYYFIGMDERAEPYSGGMLLFNYLLEQEAEQGALSIDMMFGLSQNKERFANQQHAMVRCTYDNPRIMSTMRNGWVRLAKRVTGQGQSVLPRC
jgi:CelD/BcsL family acetyltransferase involved in cellulose biosynthesis